MVDSFAQSICPVLYVKPDELSYWRRHKNHRPTWYYRYVVDRKRRRFCAQFIAHWPDQYDWPISRHRWDYEPVFLYFTYIGSDHWASMRSNARLEYVYYDSGNWYGRKMHPPFAQEKGHLVLALKSGFHAYEAMMPLVTAKGKADRRKCLRFLPEKAPRRLTDEVINEWRSRQENPFTILRDLEDPWSDGDGPGQRFD